MSLKPEELVTQDQTIRKTLAMVFIPMFLILAVMIYFRNNSTDYIEDEYLKIHNASYSGVITNMYEEQTGRGIRIVLMNDKTQKKIHQSIYYQLSIGDSIIKRPQSDIVYYIKKDGDTIEEDINSFYRDKYFEKLQKQ
ncbi:hypothetical protein [uncultured Kordia sp.]|uniref:hypothetical protein n=1 Tax=uncultured Kordia sp. TaxID=507699 RepID=UPI002616B41E|nr:hypothetical protein [uncultured Kordia sp.]